MDSVWGRAPAQHSTTPQRASDGQSQAATPKSGVHRSSRIAAGMPNYDRPPLGRLLKLWSAAAPLQHPRLAGRLFSPTTESVQARRNEAVGEETARGESPALGTPRPRGEEEACSRTESVLKRLELPQCARRPAAELRGETQAALETDRWRAGRGGHEAASGTFETRLATLREGYRARTKNQKIRARQQMELPQRCRRPACKDRLPNGKADYQHHGGVQGRRGLLYKGK